MALNFPTSPTVGQTYSSGGVIWTWDGVKWTGSGLAQSYLPLTGGALTGDLSITGTNANTLTIKGPSNVWPGIQMDTVPGEGAWIGSYINGNERWEIDLGNGIAETGNNAGSNFQIVRYADNGAFLDDPIIINRQTGIVALNNLQAPQAIGANRIINGDMWVDQRNNGALGTASGVYTIDRWGYLGTVAGKLTWQQQASTLPGFPYMLTFTSLSAYTSAANDYFYFDQPIEADMISDFAWGTASAQPVTLSFWAISSLTGTFSGTANNQNSPFRSYPFTYSIPAANTWTRIAITIPGDTAGAWNMKGNISGLTIFFDLGSGANGRGPANAWGTGNLVGANGAASVVATNGATLSLTGVKLEIGSVATPFNRQSLAKSMADCQRYYNTMNLMALFSNGTASTGFGSPITFPVYMRVVPTINLGSPTYTNASGLTVGFAGNTNMTLYAISTTIVGSQWQAVVTMSAEL